MTRPIALPLVALLLMLVLRACMAWWPDTTSQAPATFALLCLALVWWMGVVGAISLAEQRQTIPWGLAVLGVVGVLGLLKVADNHVMPLNTLAGVADATLATLRRNGLMVTGLLAAMSAVLWGVLLYRPATSREDPRVRRPEACVNVWAVRCCLLRWSPWSASVFTSSIGIRDRCFVPPIPFPPIKLWSAWLPNGLPR